MEETSRRSIETAVLRACPAYELVPFGFLGPGEEEMFGGLSKDPDLYGVLRPIETGLTFKSIGRDTALLYLTLKTPGPIPGYVKSMLGEECEETIAQLVLDNVLEIQLPGMPFVSGSEAFNVIYPGVGGVANETSPAAPQGLIARLSESALKYAQALDLDDALRLSARLYFYNRVPASPHWQRRFPTQESVANYLGVAPQGANQAVLNKHWTFVPLEPPYEGWLTWRSRRSRKPGAERAAFGAGQEDQNQSSAFKLYVSPDPDYVRQAFDAVVGVLTELRAPGFKVGSDLYGMLRPDKIVCYFNNWDDLHEAAQRLRQELETCPAQGVPFTAGLDDDGLMSWGMDPPVGLQLVDWQSRESWRLWVTNRLASALISARSTPVGCGRASDRALAIRRRAASIGWC